jgi:hypothetical protein
MHDESQAAPAAPQAPGAEPPRQPPAPGEGYSEDVLLALDG